MAKKYLFGPVSPTYAAHNLGAERNCGNCITFDPHGKTDLAIGPYDSWDDLCARLPSGWRPDFLVLFLPYSTVPRALWSAPLPIIGLAADWNLLWHYYRLKLPTCDFSFTDQPGVERFRRLGFTHVGPGNFFGCSRPLLERAWSTGPRDIDILYVGSLHTAEKRDRLPWLARLALGLGQRWRVAIRTGVRHEDYWRLLNRARLVFNQSVRGECNLRTFEAAAAGAVLLQEKTNREIGHFFTDGESCVLYDETNLEQVAESLLTDEGRRQEIAATAARKVRRYGFESLWGELVEEVGRRWKDLVAAAARRRALSPAAELMMRCWQSVCSSTNFALHEDPDPHLIPDLASAVCRDPGSGLLEHALGLSLARALQRRRENPRRVALAALPHFRRAVAAAPAHAVARLNLAECLSLLVTPAEAAAEARTALEIVETGALDRDDLHMGHFPPTYDSFRVEWERAAWLNPDSPAGEAAAKLDLLRWRLHALLAELGDDLAHHEAAVRARGDIGVTHTSLGLRLLRDGRFHEARSSLDRALRINPFDRRAAAALGTALVAVQSAPDLSLLKTQRQALARATPGVVPSEPWFTDDGGTHEA